LNTAKNKQLLSRFFSVTESPRIVHFCAAFVLSGVLALLVDLVFFLASGPTTIGTWYNVYRIALVFVVLFISASGFLLRKSLADKPERLYLIIVLSISLLYCVSFGVKSVSWDQEIHYTNVLAWQTFGEEIVLTTSAQTIIDSGLPQNVVSGVSLEQLSEYRAYLDSNDTGGEVVNFEKNASKFYRALPYFPSALVMALCKALQLPFSVTYVLSILPMLLIYSVVTFLGMRKLQGGKMLYAVIALLPTAVFLTSTYGYDYWVNAFALYGFATLVSHLQQPEKPMTMQSCVLMLGAFVVGFAPKVIYAPLILLCLLIPKSQFSSPQWSRNFRFVTIGTAVVVFATFFVPYFLGEPGVGDPRGGGSNPAEQMSFIMSNPFEYATILLRFWLFGGDFLPGYLTLQGSEWYMTHFAYLGFPMKDLWLITLVLFIFCIFTDYGKSNTRVVNAKSRTAATLLCGIVVTLLVTAIYVDFNAVAATNLIGMQPRYLIPLLFCFFMLVRPARARLSLHGVRGELYNGGILAVMVIVLLASFWQLFARFLV